MTDERIDQIVGVVDLYSSCGRRSSPDTIELLIRYVPKGPAQPEPATTWLVLYPGGDVTYVHGTCTNILGTRFFP